MTATATFCSAAIVFPRGLTFAAAVPGHPHTMRFLIAARSSGQIAMAARCCAGVPCFAKNVFLLERCRDPVLCDHGSPVGAAGRMFGGFLDRSLGRTGVVWEISVVTVLLLVQLRLRRKPLLFG